MCKKNMKGLAYILPIIMISVIVSCGDDDDNPMQPVHYEGQDADGKQIADDIETIISKNVSVTSRYSEYSWDITISTTLSDVYPSNSISYGIDCGYDGNYQYYKYADGSGNTYSVTAELYMTKDNTPYVSLGMYYISYLSYLEKQKKGTLKDYDKEPFQTITKALKNKENEAKSRYCCRVFVEIDNEKYFIKQINWND